MAKLEAVEPSKLTEVDGGIAPLAVWAIGFGLGYVGSKIGAYAHDRMHGTDVPTRPMTNFELLGITPPT
jgi:hypothetical protein